ncbi:MAG: site-specific integrase [Piscinibacter sp.]|uniref:tyrosine-type recombinase/integrase n=1 Tax=Piscinibacter sp. TaxID=1903157 RepID=UPI0025837AA9|nr:site-specific integrase [Piscinibacter sp.]MCW5665443.1 site-specific integrase [Piscinibacter sp.]
MATEATPYKEGTGWSIRLRYKGCDIYVSGQATAAAALREAARRRKHLDDHGQPAWGGPKSLNVAQALQRYAVQTLPFKKGAVQESRRINRLLRHAGLDEIVLTKVAQNPGQPTSGAAVEPTTPSAGAKPAKAKQVYFQVTCKARHGERPIPNSLRPHRRMLSVKTEDSDRVRLQIARTKFKEVTTDLLQTFVNKLVDEGAAASTVHQEVAVLRQLFNHARRRWKWFEPGVNPADGVDLPELKNERERVMSVEEQERICKALANRRAKHVAELVGLAVETAMRAEELITLAWSEVRIGEGIIALHDGKTGARSVPLSPVAIALLEKLRPSTEKSGRVFPGMTYEKLASAWRRSCEEAGVVDLHFHDVRATSATRFALGVGGKNVFLVQVLTGHKTLKSLARYVRVTAGEVSGMMKAAQANSAGPEVGVDKSQGVSTMSSETADADAPKLEVNAYGGEPAGRGVLMPDALLAANGAAGMNAAATSSQMVVPNVVHVDFAMRRRAETE